MSPILCKENLSIHFSCGSGPYLSLRGGLWAQVWPSTGLPSSGLGDQCRVEHAAQAGRLDRSLAVSSWSCQDRRALPLGLLSIAVQVPASSRRPACRVDSLLLRWRETGP